jgi:hypothetical protein
MKKCTLLILIPFFSTKSFCQYFFKLNPSIAIGAAYRAQSLRLAEKFYNNYNPYNLPLNIGRSAAYVVIDIKQKIMKDRLTIQFSNNFTYAVLGDLVTNYPTGPRFKTEKRLKRDHFFDILYPFNANRKSTNFILGVGYGFMNCGTKFKVDLFTGNYDAAGNAIFIKSGQSATRFSAPRLLFGVEKEKLNGFLIIHGTPDAERNPNPTLWIEVKATYSLTPFSKKSLKVKNIFKE